MIQFAKRWPKDAEFEADCPICEHRLRLRYTVWPADTASDYAGGAMDPEIVDAGACNCLLGQDWLQDALAEHLGASWDRSPYDEHPEV